MNKEPYFDDNIELSKAIVKTIAFFDIFDYPLTVLEIWKYIRSELPIKFEIILEVLDLPDLKELIENKEGFYFLKNRSDIIKIRKARFNYTDTKFRRAIKIARLFKIIPWVKMIAIGNLIGSNNLRESSDIDLFIVTKEKRIWLTRFFSILMIKILGLRPVPGKSQDTICLSFFVSEQSLNLKNFLLTDDIYFLYWLAFLTPIYDTQGTYEKFIKSNGWVSVALPNWSPMKINDWRNAGSGLPDFYSLFMDFLFGWSEGYFKRLQMKLFPTKLKRLMNQNTTVVVSDSVIKTHSNDRREEYRNNYKSRVNSYE